MCDCSENNQELEEKVKRLEGKVSAILSEMKMYVTYEPEKYTLIKPEEPKDSTVKVR